MNNLSTSPIKFTHHVDSYINRCQKCNEPVRGEIVEMYTKMAEQQRREQSKQEWAKNNLEYDLRTTDWILQKARSSKSYAQNLYAAMCNNEFQAKEAWPILKDQRWSCSWRYAGGIIADMREEGDYMDWYCSGIRDSSEPTEVEINSWTPEQQYHWREVYSKYVNESVVTDEIQEDLLKLGWLVILDSEQHI